MRQHRDYPDFAFYTEAAGTALEEGGLRMSADVVLTERTDRECV